MASTLARGGGERQALLSAIRRKMESDANATLRPKEAVMVLEWAIDCDDSDQKADLLDIFSVMGGMELLRNAFGCTD